MHLKTNPPRRTFRPVTAAVLGALIAAPLGAGLSISGDSAIAKSAEDTLTDQTNPVPSTKAPGIWQTDYKQALARAAEEKKQVLLDFTGSDWCPYCVRMDKEVLNQREFKNFAAGNLILVKLDFPRRKQLPPAEAEQNRKLQQKFDIQGFPTYVLLDPSGKELRRQLGYLEGGPSVFIKWARTGS